MPEQDVEALWVVYMEASGGSLADALRLALSDLLSVQAEAAFRTAALDQRGLAATIQRALLARWYDPGPADGLNGSKIKAAVRAFQEDHDLVVDG